MCTDLYVYTHTHRHRQRGTDIYMCTDLYVYTHTHTHTHTHIDTDEGAEMLVSARVYVYWSICIHESQPWYQWVAAKDTHLYIHQVKGYTHTHTNTHTLSLSHTHTHIDTVEGIQILVSAGVYVYWSKCWPESQPWYQSVTARGTHSHTSSEGAQIHAHTYTHTHTHTHRQRGTDTGQRKSINGFSRGCTYTAAKTSSPLPKSSLPGPMFRCYQKRQCGMSKEPYSVAKEAYVMSSCKANAEMVTTRVQVSLLTWGRCHVISKVAYVVCKRVQHTTAHTTAHYSTLQHTATHCNTLQPPSQKRPMSCAKECSTLQHTATHCNHFEIVHMNKAYIMCKRSLCMVKRNVMSSRKRPMFCAKEAYATCKRGRYHVQKKPMSCAKEMSCHFKRGLCSVQKRPTPWHPCSSLSSDMK